MTRLSLRGPRVRRLGRRGLLRLLLRGRPARLQQIDEANAQRAGRTVEDVRTTSADSIPAGRYGQPDEFAALVTFLASDRAAYITGEEIRCDGGLVRGR